MPEEMIIQHCSPTLAGIKTGNIFNCKYDSIVEIRKDIRQLNKLLGCKGLRILPLRCSAHSVLIYVYRPEKLKKDFSQNLTEQLLCRCGYPYKSPELCIINLMKRLKACSEFPHEIGLFLGYPPEDVEGFIKNRAGNCKCVGCWKVYGDVEKAKEKFAAYKKCTEMYFKEWSKGRTVVGLAVSAK